MSVDTAITVIVLIVLTILTVMFVTAVWIVLSELITEDDDG